ncbi:ABC transporter substrate-binding protein [Enterovirga sp.]|uniref:ABC transporter substrate-binding protein n=1 Tax=Enterovirga sp. TaxID=2026350 RepID=UPI002CCF40DA|nr:ABC transporter substrate-binding protein [Enterovirga sp.]HMO30741.1 ABC transporter substrate-binding protein [Enterovirga sp.]
MRRRLFLFSSLAFGALATAARAQRSGSVARVGWLTAQREASLGPYIAAVRGALAGLGYEEGRNLRLDYRYGDDVPARVPGLAAELVRAGADVLIVQGAAVPVVAKLNVPVPIVYVTSADPVLSGLADSLARPRGNMTGVTFMAAELNAKRLELLRELVPDLRRVALLGNPEHPGEQLEHDVSREYGQRFGLSIRYHSTRSDSELAAAFDAIARDPPQALSLFADGFAVQNRDRIIGFATEKRIPLTSGWALFARSGAVCTYGPRLIDSYRRLAALVARILEGARPADLPIEQPTVFELVFNLRTARAIGVDVPPALLARADEVIE